MNSHPGKLSIESFDYPLPEERIAQYPLPERDRSKLLIYKERKISEDIFQNLAQHLPSESLLVLNETRVIHARLLFRKESGSPVEIFCLEPLAPFRDHQQAFQQKSSTEWLCLVGNSKRWRNGALTMQIGEGASHALLQAERTVRLAGGSSQVRFSWQPEGLTFAEVLERAGRIPLPPYIQRQPVSQDEITYQTIYASRAGSVAAPTAGLHFTGKVMETLQEKRIEALKLILHVGAGTFRPVVSETLADHQMHAEQVWLNIHALEKLLGSLDKTITAVGTTSTRLLESLYWHGVRVAAKNAPAAKMNVSQWEPYTTPPERRISREAALEAVIEGMKEEDAAVLQGETSLIIAPGYQFRYPDILITNFHQPKSTLLLLIAAFIGKDWENAYRYALDNEFRFLSYGDSCLFFRNE